MRIPLIISLLIFSLIYCNNALCVRSFTGGDSSEKPKNISADTNITAENKDSNIAPKPKIIKKEVNPGKENIENTDNTEEDVPADEIEYKEEQEPQEAESGNDNELKIDTNKINKPKDSTIKPKISGQGEYQTY